MKTYDDLNDASTELYLCAVNDGDFYRQSVTPVINNLAKHYSKGIFNNDLAVRPFYRLSDSFAKMYVKEYCTEGSKIFTKQDKQECAETMLFHYMELIIEKAGELK